VALDKGFEVTGTLGILNLAARRGFVVLPTPSHGSSAQISATARTSWMLYSINRRANEPPPIHEQITECFRF
jgi:hypothetical protein